MKKRDASGRLKRNLKMEKFHACRASLSIFACSMILFIVACCSGCGTMPKKSIVKATVTNASTNNLDWVEVEWGGSSMRVGALPRGAFCTCLDFRWPRLLTAKVTFIDDITRKPYAIDLSFNEANEKIQAGQCREVVIKILSYEKAEVICK